jgi:putative membrane protein (TIGR04086 family)
MKGSITVTDEKKSTLLALLFGTLIAYALTCIAFIVCALLLRYTSFTEQSVPIFVTVSCVISVVVSGFDAAKGAEKNGWLWGLIAGAVYAAIWVIFGVLFSDDFGIDSRTLMIIVLSIAGGGLGGVVGINVKK